MRSLYEIDQELLSCLDEETGEILDETKLDLLQMERNDKIEQMCLWYKNTKAEVEALKKEEEHFKARRRAAEKRAEDIKTYLGVYLGGAPFKTLRASVYFRRTDTVVVEADAVIPAEYLKVTVEVKNSELKKAVKEGKTFDGVSIAERETAIIR